MPKLFVWYQTSSIFAALYAKTVNKYNEKHTFKSKNMDIKEASAGTLESGDILVRIAPAQVDGLEVNLESSVAYQFGDQIKKVITETLEGLGVKSAVVNATDKGALDCTIRARVTAAAVRATGKDVWQ